MLFSELITESRGVTARQSGETYVSASDPADVLTIQNISVLPSTGESFEDLESLKNAIDQAVPADHKKVEDNLPNSGTLAAILATVTDSNQKPQTWIRYIKSIPPQGIHGLWKTLKGYRYSTGAETESVPIKPSDLISDERYRTASQLANEIKSKVSNLENIGPVIENAVDQAVAGTSNPIPNAAPYFSVLQKYAGEYLGPIALISHPDKVTGDTAKMMQQLGIDNFNGASVMFPQNVSMELIDSLIQLSDGRTIQISSKISTSGGAASSLSGIYKQMTDEIKSKFPVGAKIIEELATSSAIIGPLKVALDLNIISQQDIQEIKNLSRSSQDINDIKSDNLRQMVQQQGIAADTRQSGDYRVLWHAMTAIVNRMVSVVNNMDEFKNAMLEVLNNNEYVQLVTKGKQQSNDVILTYFTKFPAVFKGSPQLYNKTYFATGQKGRIGFKLK